MDKDIAQRVEEIFDILKADGRFEGIVSSIAGVFAALPPVSMPMPEGTIMSSGTIRIDDKVSMALTTMCTSIAEDEAEQEREFTPEQIVRKVAHKAQRLSGFKKCYNG